MRYFKNLIKRGFAMILAVVMIVGLLPTASMATEEPKAEETVEIIENVPASEDIASDITENSPENGEEVPAEPVPDEAADEVSDDLLQIAFTSAQAVEAATQADEAMVNGVYYPTLQAAITKAAAGDTVTVLKDVTVVNGLALNKSVILDLDGHTISGSNPAINVWNGEIQIRNGTISAETGINMYDGKLTAENVEIQADSVGVVYYGGEELTIQETSKITANGIGIQVDALPNAAMKVVAAGEITAATPIDTPSYSNGTPVVEVCAPAKLTAVGENGVAINMNKGSLIVTGGRVDGKISVTENVEPAISGGWFSDKESVAVLLSSDYVVDDHGNVVSAASLENVAAKAGTALYASLQDAVNAGDGKTVVLLKDVQENVIVPENSVVTLDLNGKTLSGGTVAKQAALTNYGTVTILDSSEAQTGTICREDDNTKGYYTLVNAGKMYIQGGNITNNSNESSLVINYNNQGNGIFGQNEGVEMEISGGVLTQELSIALKSDPNTKLIIREGATVVSGKTSTNFYGTIVMEGGNVKMPGSVLVLSHKQDEQEYNGAFTVTGGTLECGEIKVWNGWSGGVTAGGPSFVVDGTANVMTDCILIQTRTDGVVTDIVDNNGARVEVRGGTLKTADGEIWTAAKTGSTSYLTVEAAIAAAADGETVQLLKDLQLTQSIEVSKSIVLDLNGKTVTAEDVPVFTVEAEKKLTVTGNGTVCGAQTPLFAGEGKAVVTGGSYSEDVSAYAADGYTVIKHELFDVVKLDQSNAAVSVTIDGNPVFYEDVRAAMAAANAEAAATVTLYRDVNESITVTGNIVLDLGGKTLSNTAQTDTITVVLGGTLTVLGPGTVDNTSHGCAALFNNGTAHLNGGTFDRSAERGASASDNGGNSYYTVVNHGVMRIDGATVRQNGGYSSLIENGYQNFESDNARQGHVAGVNAARPSLRIDSGTLTGGLNNVKNDDNGDLTIVSGLFTSAAQNAVLNWNTAVVFDGIYDMPVANGKGAASAVNALDMTVNNGIFANDVTDYCPSRKAAALDNGVYRIVDMMLSMDETAVVQSGKTMRMNAVIEPANVPVVWTSDDETIASVDENGVVTGHARGTVTITMSARGMTASCEVTVMQFVTGVTLDQTAVTLSVNDTVTLTAVVTPADAEDVSVTWTSDNEAVAVVIDGVVTAVAPGTAVVTVMTADGGYTASCTVTVKEDTPPVPVNPPDSTTITEPDVPLASVLPFDDVTETDWFYEAVKYVYENDLMQGVSDNRFEPHADTTRGMIVTILYRLEGSPAVSGTSEFNDVTAGAWYHDAVLWGTANEIVAGYGDGTYGPADRITREQLAAILYRYAQFKGYDVNVSDSAALNFADGDAVSDYAKAAMLWAVEKELIHGMGDDMLSARSGAARAQVSAILNAFCTNVVT